MFIISLMVAIMVFSLFMWADAALRPDKEELKKRLKAFTENKDEINVIARELQQPFAERVLRPFLKKLTGLSNKIMPIYILDNIQPRLTRAGHPGGLSPGEYFILKVLGLVVLMLISIPLLVGGKLSIFLLMVAIGGAIVWIGPDLYLNKLAQDRISMIDKAMPDVLDLLTVSVEAGYGWDGALKKVVEKRKGPLAVEFRRVIQEVKMGKPRRDALRNMSGRLLVDSVTTFVTAIIQADQLGLGLGQVLRTQSDQIRHKRKQEVEEEAMKAPIKMLFPLVLFIFPVVFIILLGPAMIQMLEVFR